MPHFYASTSRGLGPAVERELKALDLKVLETHHHGVLFDSPWQGCFRANLKLFGATRVTLPILDFPAYNDQEIYDNVKKHDFTRYLKPNQTFMVKSQIDQCAIKDQRIVALKLKDAIADQFTEKFGERPNVDKQNPDIRFFIFGTKNQFHVSVDTSGGSLSMRGYRKDAIEAPLREHVASGLLNLMEWDQKTPIVDPMCGSGTILIEAALQAMKMAPGSFRKKFSWQNFTHIEKDAWNEEVEKALAEEMEECPVHFYGYDKDFKAIKAAKANAERAGVADAITFEKRDVVELEAPVEKGVIVTNPPYGVRIGDEFFLEETYKNLAHTMKSQFSGWDMWLLSGEAQWTRHLKLKAERKIQVANGNIDCRFIHYKIR